MTLLAIAFMWIVGSIIMASEGDFSGFRIIGTVLLYILLFITILGWLILIPLLLRKKTETVTYAVCQSCGYQKVISRR